MVEEAERELNRQLKEADKDPVPVLWELVRLYNATHRQELALQCLRAEIHLWQGRGGHGGQSCRKLACG